MKNLIVLPILLVAFSSCFAQPPDLVGYKASIKQLEDSYGSYTVKEGHLLDVQSYNEKDNIYLNAKITGESLGSTFNLTTNSNGIVDFINYNYNSILEDHFNFLKETIIKLHKAKYYKVEDGVTIYVSELVGIKKYILFKRVSSGNADVALMLK